MKTYFRAIGFALAMALAAPQAASAQQMSPEQFAEALKRYDPDTVAAAAAYAKTFDMSTKLAQASQRMLPGLTAQVKAKNPTMTEEQAKLFTETYSKIAFVDSAPILEQATMLLMLDIFSKDELTALNQFYSSPVGAGILKKMPDMMGKMPQVMRLMETYVIPKALEGARDALKSRGFEVKI